MAQYPRTTTFTQCQCSFQLLTARWLKRRVAVGAFVWAPPRRRSRRALLLHEDNVGACLDWLERQNSVRAAAASRF
jgi:hypothetical protein